MTTLIDFSASAIIRYKESAIKEIKTTQQTVDDHTRKVVQMHHLARNFAARLGQKVSDLGVQDVFKKVMFYNNIFMGKLEDGELVTVEEFVEGEMVKYVNNDGEPLLCGNEDIAMNEKANCLVHFSYEDSGHEVMLVDVQGVGYSLFDPEIASAQLINDDKEILFTTGNLSGQAISNFIGKNTCNVYCECLKLAPMCKKDD